MTVSTKAFTCPRCAYNFKVSLTGQAIRCPQCKTIVQSRKEA